MIIFINISAVVILFLAAGAVFWGLQVKKVKHLEYIVSEAIWARRNKIPLLIETARKAGIKGIPNVVPDLRGNDTYSALLSDIFRKAEQDISLLALKKEFSTDQEKIKIALNNYNLEKARFSGLFSKYAKLEAFNRAE